MEERIQKKPLCKAAHKEVNFAQLRLCYEYSILRKSFSKNCSVPSSRLERLTSSYSHILVTRSTSWAKKEILIWRIAWIQGEERCEETPKDGNATRRRPSCPIRDLPTIHVTDDPGGCGHDLNVFSLNLHIHLSLGICNHERYGHWRSFCCASSYYAVWVITLTASRFIYCVDNLSHCALRLAILYRSWTYRSTWRDWSCRGTALIRLVGWMVFACV